MPLQYDREELYQKVWERPNDKGRRRVQRVFGYAGQGMPEALGPGTRSTVIGRSWPTDTQASESPHCQSWKKYRSSIGRRQRIQPLPLKMIVNSLQLTNSCRLVLSIHHLTYRP